MRFSVNLSIVYPDLPLLERAAAAAAAGFDAVELWWPFEDPDPPRGQLRALADAIGDAGVKLAALNFYAGDMGAGDRGVLSNPDREAQFRANIGPAIDLAEKLGCRIFNALYGNRVEGVDPVVQDDLATENLAMAAEAVRGIGGTVVIEALNSLESPAYPLTTTRQALAVIDRVNSEQASESEVRYLYDIYHMQRMEGDLITTIREHVARFGHVQLADVPARTQPGTGEIAFERVLDALHAAGYDGSVGLEYRSTEGLDPFAWLPTSERTRWSD
jgi:hydroxypyruvate isomerase